MADMLNGIIAKANGKDKVIDFRDGLVVATPQDYAMIFGVGGKNHAPNSVIKVTICDFSKGKGENSITVSGNLELDVIARIAEVVSDRMKYNPTFLMEQQKATASSAVPKAGRSLSAEECATFRDAMRIIVKAAQDNPGDPAVRGDVLVDLGKKMRKVYNAIKSGTAESENSQQKSSTRGNKINFPDWVHTQERVNIYKQGKDGLAPDVAPVSLLAITRKGIRDDGQISRYPWTIKITNGTARVKTSNIGGTTYESGSFKTTAEAFIAVSDADMDRMMQSCQRFIRVFELTYGIPLVQRGIQEKNRQREEWLNNMT